MEIVMANVGVFLCALALTWIAMQLLTAPPRRSRMTAARAEQLRNGWSRGQLSLVTKPINHYHQPIIRQRA